jgi:hypothetical protein
MKHSLIILISFLLLSSPVIGNNHKGETLYRWSERFDYKWRGFGDKETHPKYTGDVKNGKPNGLGYLIYPSGRKYVGSWKDGKQNGQGTHTFPNGTKYEGEYKDGKWNGQGIYTFRSGSKFVGEWKNGNFWNGTQYDKYENITGKIVNGERVKQ